MNDTTQTLPVAIADEPVSQTLIRMALDEDVGAGDATTLALVPDEARIRARLLTRRPCRVAGLPLAVAVLRELDARVEVHVCLAEGADAEAGATLLCVEGPARALLTGERTALNFAQRLTGIATLTREFVRRVAPHPVAILDTRKTTPGWRALEKYAVRCGGGVNHRTGLYDRVLIKDNHRRLWRGADGAARLDLAVAAARAAYPALLVEVEVETEAELHSALAGAPDWILLDNLPPERLRRFVAIATGRCKLEASGGITLDNVAAVAATGVDAISLGCLTHSAPAADLSLEFD